MRFWARTNPPSRISTRLLAPPNPRYKALPVSQTEPWPVTRTALLLALELYPSEMLSTERTIIKPPLVMTILLPVPAQPMAGELPVCHAEPGSVTVSRLLLEVGP